MREPPKQISWLCRKSHSDIKFASPSMPIFAWHLFLLKNKLWKRLMLGVPLTAFTSLLTPRSEARECTKIGPLAWRWVSSRARPPLWCKSFIQFNAQQLLQLWRSHQKMALFYPVQSCRRKPWSCWVQALWIRKLWKRRTTRWLQDRIIDIDIEKATLLENHFDWNCNCSCAVICNLLYSHVRCQRSTNTRRAGVREKSCRSLVIVTNCPKAFVRLFHVISDQLEVIPPSYYPNPGVPRVFAWITFCFRQNGNM